MLNSNFLYAPPTLSLISLSLAAYNTDRLPGVSWSSLSSQIRSGFLWQKANFYSHIPYEQIHPKDKSVHASGEKHKT